jgi:hypothetical protein
LLAEIYALKSNGPFVLDTSNPHLIYCEDAGVYLDPSQPQGMCDKLNQLTAKLAKAKELIRQFARHHIDCMKGHGGFTQSMDFRTGDVSNTTQTYPCTCGLDNRLSSIKEGK